MTVQKPLIADYLLADLDTKRKEKFLCYHSKVLYDMLLSKLYKLRLQILYLRILFLHYLKNKCKTY